MSSLFQLDPRFFATSGEEGGGGGERGGGGGIKEGVGGLKKKGREGGGHRHGDQQRDRHRD